MPPKVEKFFWNDLANVPDSPGIYAWYYSPEITEFDLEKAISDLNSIHVPSERERAAQIVRELLERRLFSYFREDPYEALIEGQLSTTAGVDEFWFCGSSVIVWRAAGVVVASPTKRGCDRDRAALPRRDAK